MNLTLTLGGGACGASPSQGSAPSGSTGAIILQPVGENYEETEEASATGLIILPETTNEQEVRDLVTNRALRNAIFHWTKIGGIWKNLKVEFKKYQKGHNGWPQTWRHRARAGWIRECPKPCVALVGVDGS